MDRARAKAVEANRDLWDKRVRAHLAHGLYPSEKVLAGTYELGEPDASELGDVAGLRVLHLQCNAGADTIALARLGAHATGVDFSEEAIAEARRLAREAGVDATFVCADVYDLPADLGTFDVVYTSMGVLWWLPDLTRWAAVVAGLLAPDGRFHLSELHPFTSCLADVDDRFVVEHDYLSDGEPVVFETAGTYYEAPADFAAEAATEHGWQHGIGEILTALCDAGLRIRYVREHERAGFRMLPTLVRGDDGFWHSPPGRPRVPFHLTVLATR